ncbi:MAG: NAD(P)-dependent oxidoreductase [bacterium]|nr:NAD(P)-dependent oxidoreductase [bacterium]
MTEKVFILGTRGFIGARLMEKFSQQASGNVVGYNSQECDLLSRDSIVAALSSLTKEDTIVMVSAITRLKENSYDSMIRNIQMAENLGWFLEEHYVSGVIFFSTVDVYGILPEHAVIKEELLPDPNDYYAISKLTSEYLLRKTLSRKGIPMTVFRLSGVYGSGDEGKSTINALVKSALTKGKITVHGDGSNKRDFVYVDDVFSLTAEAIRQKKDVTVNVATGRSFSIAEISEMIVAAMDGKCSVEFTPTDHQPGKRITHMVYNINKLNDLFPGMTLTGIRDGIEYYLSEMKS